MMHACLSTKLHLAYFLSSKIEVRSLRSSGSCFSRSSQRCTHARKCALATTAARA